MSQTRATTRREYALGMLALFLLGLIGAAFGLSARLRRLVAAPSHRPPAVAIDRGEISYDR
jgi:hypothetical protein